MSAGPDHDHEDYYRYTSGRWLWNEDSQLGERYKRFNVSELKKIAAKSIGAQDCVAISKLAEGGFNKVFRLVMDDNSIVIACIPNPNAGPQFKTTASEVATMDFVCGLVRRGFGLLKLIGILRLERFLRSRCPKSCPGAERLKTRWNRSIF
jgi:hypothetical protein